MKKLYKLSLFIIGFMFAGSWSAYAQSVETGGYTGGSDYRLACGGYTETVAPDVNVLFTVDNNPGKIITPYTGPVRIAAYTVMLPKYNSKRIVLRSADGSLFTVDKVPKAF